jgi:hypothetical protein
MWGWRTLALCGVWRRAPCEALEQQANPGFQQALNVKWVRMANERFPQHGHKDAGDQRPRQVRRRRRTELAPLDAALNDRARHAPGQTRVPLGNRTRPGPVRPNRVGLNGVRPSSGSCAGG